MKFQAPQPWLSRTFNYDFPVAYFPNIISRLNNLIPITEYIANTFSNHLLQHKTGGKWSAQEHIGHLVDLEELHLGRLADYRQNKEVLRPADMTNSLTQKNNHNSKNIFEITEQLSMGRKKFITELTAFPIQKREQRALHERTETQMRVIDLAYFVAEHDTHHIAWCNYLLHSET